MSKRTELAADRDMHDINVCIIIIIYCCWMIDDDDDDRVRCDDEKVNADDIDLKKTPKVCCFLLPSFTE